MPENIQNTEDFESTVQRRVLGRIFQGVNLESDYIKRIEEYRTGKIVAEFAPTSKGEGVTKLTIQ